MNIQSHAIWLLEESKGKPAQKPRGSWPKNWQPEHLHVWVCNAITMRLYNGVFPLGDCDGLRRNVLHDFSLISVFPNVEK